MPPGDSQVILDYFTPPPRLRRVVLRFAAWISLVAVLLIGNFLLMYDPGNIGLIHGAISTWPILGAIVLGIAYLLFTTPSDAIRLRRGRSFWLILAGCLFLVTSGVALVYPRLSDDMLRYRLDGRMWSQGFSPWAARPDESPYRDYVDKITPYSWLRSIYPPTAQLLFVTSEFSTRSMEGAHLPHRISVIADRAKGTLTARHAAFFRISAAFCVLISTAVLLLALHFMRRSPWYAVLFAWHPLTIIESAGQGHIDIVGVLLVVIAAFALLRNRFLFAAIALALAVGVKPHVVMLAPVLIIAAAKSTNLPSPLPPSRSTRRGSVVVALVFLAALFAVYSPLILNKANFAGWRESAAVYSMTWEANGSIYELLTTPFRGGDGKSLEAAKLYARLLGGLAAFMTLYVCVRNRLPLADCAYWLFMIPLLFAPVVYPWYLLWSLAMVPLLQRSRGWTMLVWAATSGLSYQLLREPTWRLPAAWALAEYLPVYLALGFELWSMQLGRSQKIPSNEPLVASLAPSR